MPAKPRPTAGFSPRLQKQFQAISEIAKNSSAAFELNILARLLVLEVAKAMDCPAGDLWLREDKTRRWHLQTRLGVRSVPGDLNLAGPFSEAALERGEILLISKFHDQPGLPLEALAQAKVKSLAVLPLVTRNKALGAMHLYASRPNGFSVQEKTLLSLFSQQCAVAIENNLLFSETKSKAQELLALYEIAQVISELSSLETAMSQIVERVAALLTAEKCWFMFLEEQTGQLAAHPTAVGAVEEQLAALRVAPTPGTVSGTVYTQSQPFYTNDAAHEPRVEAEFKDVFTLRNLMAVPLRGRQQTLGVFLAGNKRAGTDFTAHDVRLFKTLASEAAVVIQNAGLYGKLRRSYFSIVQVISDMIDAREPFTRGHSERVSGYAVMIARELRMSGEALEAIRMAGWLHDIGKIGVPERILTKDGKLTAEEFAEIKKHPLLGEHILKPVEFPWDILGLVRHHHERLDGHGYPDGLAGEAIPLGARILAVVDAFDVMTTKRTYQEARVISEAFDELRKQSGTQFDPKVVAAFANAWTREKAAPAPTATIATPEDTGWFK